MVHALNEDMNNAETALSGDRMKRYLLLILFLLIVVYSIFLAMGDRVPKASNVSSTVIVKGTGNSQKNDVRSQKIEMKQLENNN